MLKTAWILPLMMLIAIVFAVASVAPSLAFAAEDDFGSNVPSRYHDLPGVVPEAERVQRQDYTCSSSIEYVYRGRGRYDILYGDVAPRQVYRCKTENGVTYSGTRPPNTHWIPGLNPLHLPK